jgi:hypothetical protein
VTLLFVILSIFPAIRVENESQLFLENCRRRPDRECSWLDYLSRRKAQSGGLEEQ